MNKLDKILVALAVFLLFFTVTMVVVFVVVGSEPSTLIMSVFAICGTECGAMAWIKTAKEKYGKENEDGEMVSDRRNSDYAG